jgi:hypothetical protein
MLAAATCSRWFLARGFFYPEDGGDTFLRNVGSHKICTAPHPRKRHASTLVFITSFVVDLLSLPSKYTVVHIRDFLGRLHRSAIRQHRASPSDAKLVEGK